MGMDTFILCVSVNCSIKLNPVLLQSMLVFLDQSYMHACINAMQNSLGMVKSALPSKVESIEYEW